MTGVGAVGVMGVGAGAGVGVGAKRGAPKRHGGLLGRQKEGT